MIIIRHNAAVGIYSDIFCSKLKKEIVRESRRLPPTFFSHLCLFRIDCVGILKLRNADIELRNGETDIGRKNTRVRLVFRVHIPEPGGHLVSLQVASNPVECCKTCSIYIFIYYFIELFIYCVLSSSWWCCYVYLLSTAQRSAQEFPAVERQDLDRCSVLGGQQMVLTGQNFTSDSKVIFSEKAQGESFFLSK